MHGISYQIYEQQEELKPEIQKQVVSLFRESYYNYHYIDEICSCDRVRFIAFEQDRVIGYATYKKFGRYAYFSNLVVKSQYRGQGIGKQIEKIRFQHSNDFKLNMMLD